MTGCSRCGRDLDENTGGGTVTSISGGIMGDEYTESYYFCRDCGVYTVKIVHDRFLGEETVFSRGPVPKADGDARIELIRQCPGPWDKKCRCPAHQAYFGGTLD
jgi:hypothetical protein